MRSDFLSTRRWQGRRQERGLGSFHCDEDTFSDHFREVLLTSTENVFESLKVKKLPLVNQN